MTWTIIAKEGRTGQLGIATTTHAFGVGPVADWPQAGVGVVATQSFVDISYGPLGLALLARGVPAQQALDELLAADEHRQIRQVAFLDALGNIAHFTGRRCVPHCGAALGEDVIVIGNMLADEAVLTDTLAAYEASPADSFAGRLLDGLDAGQAAGGDARGRMSAALRIVTADRPEQPWQGSLLDLRVDYADQPLRQLRRDLAAHQAYEIFFGAVFGPGLVNGPEPVMGEALERAVAELGEAQRILGEDYEATLWQGVLLLRAGRADAGQARISAALAARPEFATFLDGLLAIGIIPSDTTTLLRDARP